MFTSSRRGGVRVGLAVAVAVAGARVASRPTLVPWPARVRPAFIAVTTLVSATVAYVAAGSLGIRGGGLPSLGQRARRAVVASAAGAGLLGTYRIAKHQAGARLEGAGREIESGFSIPPTLHTVSGGPGSHVDFATVGREGARFVGSSVPADVVEQVTGSMPRMEAIRVFVGVDSAATAEERVALALEELRRTAAYDRSVLLIGSPAGSGYANPTPVDVVEILTLGDCASVAVAYGLLPSFLSLDRVGLAGHTQSLLLEAIATDLIGRAHRPRLVLYGESLGARVQQRALPAGTVDLDRLGVHAALWVGTPGGSESVDFHADVAAESITVDRPEQVPVTLPVPRPRVWFLEHDGDPVVRFEPTVMYRRPFWLGAPPRGRNVPQGMVWAPGITWAQVLVDTLFATHIVPGNFESRGHDYRADLGGIVPAAFGFAIDSATTQRLESALRQLEVTRAQRVNEA
ncbi:MAG: alpha/beta-hydrolase family protein [Candidatus Nanopelagicales bacterium]